MSHHQQRLPTDNSNEHLANTFADFFETKIDNIRNNFNSIDTTNREAIRETTFSNLRPTTTDEVKQLILTMNNKSCILDPIPAWLLTLYDPGGGALKAHPSDFLPSRI